MATDHCDHPNCIVNLPHVHTYPDGREALRMEIASLRTQLAAATERYERAVALHNEVRARLCERLVSATTYTVGDVIIYLVSGVGWYVMRSYDCGIELRADGTWCDTIGEDGACFPTADAAFAALAAARKEVP